MNVDVVYVFSEFVNLMVDLNYDCLRAIVYEINSGESFHSAIEDLNIINLSKESYHLTIYFKNGSPMRIENKHIDWIS